MFINKGIEPLVCETFSFDLSVNVKVTLCQRILEERTLPSKQPTNLIFKKSKISQGCLCRPLCERRKHSESITKYFNSTTSTNFSFFFPFFFLFLLKVLWNTKYNTLSLFKDFLLAEENQPSANCPPDTKKI